jgi:hypothetical protein
MSVSDDFASAVAHIRSWGFQVVEWSGCYGRSNGGGWSAGVPVGHGNHHYVCSMNPDQGYIDGLVGNLASGSVVNWFADVNGVAYLIGTGPMNHFGTGNQSVLDRTRSDQPPPGAATSQGSISGNSHYSGTECQHPGDSTPWPGPMLDVMVAINAAEFLVWGLPAACAIDHYEWTNRKIDMSAGGGASDNWAGDELRRRVADRMAGTTEGDYLDMVTEDQWNDLVGKVTECQQRLRGADTGAGERHEHFDMLQGIDAATSDTQYRVRGADTGPGQRHEHFDMLQGIDGAVSGGG